MMEVIKIDNSYKSEWDRLVKTSLTATFFQTLEYFNFLKSLTFLEAFAYGCTEDNKLVGVVVGYIQKDGGKIKQFFSKRAIIIGGPLLDVGISDSNLSQFLKHIKRDLKNKAIYVETRNLCDFSRYKDVFELSDFKYVEHLNFHVDCTDESVTIKKMSSSKMRQVKKSLKNGVEICEAVKEKDVKDFYSLLSDLYETKVKTPLFPIEYFMEYFRLNTGKYLLVRYNSEIIGGIMCPILDNRAIYELFVVGKDYGEYKNLYPSIVATWAAIDYATKNNLKRFDFMGAGKPNEEYGVRDFKSKFGGELVEHGRFLCVINPLLYNVGKIAVKLLKRM